jgi:hypothetical protein
VQTSSRGAPPGRNRRTGSGSFWASSTHSRVRPESPLDKLAWLCQIWHARSNGEQPKPLFWVGSSKKNLAFQKKSKKGVKTPKAELDLIRRRLKAAEEHYAEWRAAQEEEEDDESGAGSRG